MDDASISHELIAQARGLRDAKQPEQAYQAFSALHERFADSAEPTVRLDVAEALLNIGAMNLQTGQTEEALATFDQVILKYPEAGEFVAAALINKLRAFMNARRPDESLAICADVVSRFPDGTGLFPHFVAEALLSRGVVLIWKRQFDDALELLDELSRRYGNSSDPQLLSVAAGALYNKGIAHRDASRPAESVKAFSEAVERFADASLPATRRWVALALYNRTITLGNIEDADGAIKSAEEMQQRFAGSPDPAIRQRLAKALYHRAVLLFIKDRLMEAVMAFGELYHAFLRDPDPAVGTVVAAARRRFLLTMASCPFGYDEEKPYNPFMEDAMSSVFGEVRASLPDGKIPEGDIPKLLERFRPDIEKRADQALNMHLNAGSIINGYLMEGAPFGLFLRNFETEGFVRATARDNITRVDIGGESLIEKQMAEACRDRLPLLGIANNTPMSSSYVHHIPKIRVPNDYWQGVIEELAKAAALVIMNVERLTPGVVSELDMLIRLDKAPRTLVVVSEPESTMNVLWKQHTNAPPDPPAQLDSAAIARFPYSFKISDFIANEAKNWTLFDVMLELIEKTYKHERETGKRWDAIVY